MYTQWHMLSLAYLIASKIVVKSYKLSILIPNNYNDYVTTYENAKRISAVFHLIMTAWENNMYLFIGVLFFSISLFKLEATGSRLFVNR